MAFNFFLEIWSVFSLVLQTERTIGSHGDRLRLVRSNLPEMRSGNRAETPSVFSPRKRKVLTKDSRGNVRSPRHDYRILAAALLDRVYRRRLFFPCSRVPRSKRRSDDFVSLPSYVLEGKTMSLFNAVLFVTQPECALSNFGACH